MALDSSGGDEQGLGDLAVSETLGGQLGDAALTGGECFEPAKQHPARLGSGGAQLGLSPSGQRRRVEAVGDVDGLAEQLADLDAVVAATQDGTQVGPGAGLFEAGVGAGEHLDRLAQQGLAALTAGYEPGGSERHAQGSRSTEDPGQLELFPTQASRRVGFTESQRGDGSLGTPPQEGGADGPDPGGDLAHTTQVGEGVAEAPLGDPETRPA